MLCGYRDELSRAASRIGGIGGAPPSRCGFSAPAARLYAPLRLGREEADGTGDAGAAEAAVAVRILREVLLVVVLGVVERPGLRDLGGDLAVARFRELLLEHRARRLRHLPLRLAAPVDSGAVLRAEIVPLPHALRRVVALPAELE